MTVEELYQSGKMPSFAYYQLNGKTANENYRDFKNKQSAKFLNEILNRQQIEKEIEELVYDSIEPILNDLIDGINKSGK